MGPITGKAAKAFAAQGYLKFAATVDDEGTPNVVPLLSAKSIDSETIAFVRFMVWKTARNFESNQKMSFGCTGPWGKAYVAKGEFVEWQTSGPLLEKFEEEPIYRYNAYMGANQVGVVKVSDVIELPGSGILKNLALGLARKASFTRPAAAAGADGPMPPNVSEKFNRAAAVKFLGIVDAEGEPLAIPHQGIRAPEPGIVSFPLPTDKSHPLSGLADGDLVASSVLAFEPSSYQAKGKFRKEGYKGVIEVESVYAAAPPLPGKRIWPVEIEEAPV